MKCIDKMKCSAVVDRAGGHTGRPGAEILEWRTDRRNLSVLVKKITDIISTRTLPGMCTYMYVCGEHKLDDRDGMRTSGSLSLFTHR